MPATPSTRGSHRSAASQAASATAARTAARQRTRVARSEMAPASADSIWVSRSGAGVLASHDFLDLYRVDPLSHVRFVKEGVAPRVIDGLADGLNLSKDRLMTVLGLRRETIRRRTKANEALSAEESSRVLGIGRLIGQVQAMVEASGDPEGFDAAAWVGAWLDRPLPALGGQRPAELMDTAEGQAVVANLLARAQSGAYA
jgi:putative toxin-antitoxin system antitoxin component (TIGR02293 family)